MTAVCRDLGIACSIAVRRETAPAQRPGAPVPVGQDLASSHSPGSLRSWTWGGGGPERGWGAGESPDPPGLALFINTVCYSMCPPLYK